MSIKLAIHLRRGGFSDRWIQYCSEHGIDYKVVNCYDSNLLEQLNGISGLLWHWNLNEPAAQLVSRQIVASVEMMGIKVFPNTVTCWHYDDKIGQKYLLESIGAPLVKSYVFYGKEVAMEWIDKTEFPKVFKLSCGAGSLNVKMVNTREEARRLCKKAFAKGFCSVGNYFSDTKTKTRKVKNLKDLICKLNRMPKTIRNILIKKKFLPREKNYIYFQDFIPNNNFDTRITVIGNRAFGFTRNTRPNDFRASGSGSINYDLDRIDKRCIQIAFDTVKRLGTQSLAFDFVFNQNHDPKIIEISYCYQDEAVYNCTGYWDYKMNWHEGHLWPEDAILIDFLSLISLDEKNSVLSM